MKPTEQQLKEFWERYLVKEENDNGYCWWKDGEGELVCASYNRSPSIDLNSLFRYAVPKAILKLADMDLSTNLEAYYKLFEMWLKQGTDALALFWALDKIREV